MTVTGQASEQATARPFGLRYLVEPPPETATDLDEDAVIYDPVAQIAMVREGGALVPVCRHKGRKTKTQTQRDDKRAPDTDEDVEG